jgi:hypothetical protein
LEHQLEDTKAEVTELRERLTQLWDRLHEEYGNRESFLAAHRGHSAETLKAVCIEFSNYKMKYNSFTYQKNCIIIMVKRVANVFKRHPMQQDRCLMFVFLHKIGVYFVFHDSQ